MLPLNDVADFFHRAEQFAKVLGGRGAAAGSGRADLKLPQVVLQLIDGLPKGKFVPHLLNGVHVAHAEGVEVLASLQDGAVAGHLLRVLADGEP